MMKTANTPRPITVIICFFMIATSSFCYGNGECEDCPTKLIYGYYHGDDEYKHFMTDVLENHLSTFDLEVEIEYSNTFRSETSWYDSGDRLELYFASGQCDAHALSLSSAAISAMRIDLLREYLYSISRSDLADYAPNYYRGILGGEMAHNSPYMAGEDEWYALTGYRYVNQQSTFHMAAKKRISDQLPVERSSLYTLPGRPSTKLSIADEPVKIKDLYWILVELSAKRPERLLAWDNFEFSFAPLYSAYGISTIWKNLLNVQIHSLPVTNDQSHPVQISDEYKSFIKELSMWYDQGIIYRDFHVTSRAHAEYVAVEHDLLSTPFFSTSVRPTELFRQFAGMEDEIALFQIVNAEYTMNQSWESSPYQDAEVYPESCVGDHFIEPLLRVFEYTRWPGYAHDIEGLEQGWMQRVFGELDEHYEIVNLKRSRASGQPHYSLSVLPKYVRNLATELPGDRDPNEYAMWHFKRYPEITVGPWTEVLLMAHEGEEESSAERLGSALVQTFFGGRRVPMDLSTVLGNEFDTSALSDFTRTSLLDWIVGPHDDVEKQWDSYVDEWIERGGDEIIKALQAGT